MVLRLGRMGGGMGGGSITLDLNKEGGGVLACTRERRFHVHRLPCDCSEELMTRLRNVPLIVIVNSQWARILSPFSTFNI